MNVQRYVNIGYAVVGIVAWVIAARFFAVILDLFEFDRPLVGADFLRSDLLGLVCGVAAGVALKMNQAVNTWALEVANELRKVSWPTWEETRLATIVVVITSILVAVVLGLFDTFWAFVSSAIYSLG